MEAIAEQAIRIAKALESIAKNLTYLVEEIVTLRQDYFIHLAEVNQRQKDIKEGYKRVNKT